MSKKLTDVDNWSDVVGMPDEWDKKNIQALVDLFYATTFDIPTSDAKNAPMEKITGKQWTEDMLQDARMRHGLDGPNDKEGDYGLKSKNMDMRIMCTVPFPLYKKLLDGYPTLFKDYKHQLWFAKNFPMFRIPKKI